MTKTVFILNGPNLNLLGQRQPEIYGSKSLGDVEKECISTAKEHDLDVRFLQSNAEHEIINWIHDAREQAQAIIINPAAFSHTSVAILDALIMYEGLVIEVHISNVHQRETFRHHSYVSQRSDGVIVGLGTNGYQLALKHVADVI